MPLETASTIADLVSTNPVGASDTPAALDDHIRLIKTVLKADAMGASTVHAATTKATPIDADSVGLVDTAASNVLKKLTWANIKATLKTYFDTLYQPTDALLTSLAGQTVAANKVQAYSASDTASLLDFKDEDDMASNSATAVPSQQSVKAYVDAVETITQGTAVSASGTSVAFTSLPATVKKITLMLSGVSTNGSSAPMIQLGDSEGLESTGYSAASSDFTTAVGTSFYTSGFGIRSSSAANVIYGAVEFCLINPSTNTWVAHGIVNFGSSEVCTVSGSKSLSGTLDRIAITTANGSDTFDAGTVNIIYQ